MNYRRELLLLHLAVVLLGFTGLFAKFISHNPAVIICGRSVFTALSVVALLFWFREKLTPGSWGSFALFIASGALLAAHWMAFFGSIQISTVAIGVIGFSTYPIFVTLLEPVFFRERLRASDLTSAVIVCVGLVIVVPEADISNEKTLAILIAVFSGLVLAFYTLLNRRLVKQHHYLTLTLYQHSLAGLLVLPIALMSLPKISVQDILLFALLGTVFTALPQGLLVRSLNTVKAQLASVLVGLEPVYSIVLALILLGEVPSGRTLLGGVIVAVAVVLATRSHGVVDSKSSDAHVDAGLKRVSDS